MLFAPNGAFRQVNRLYFNRIRPLYQEFPSW